MRNLKRYGPAGAAFRAIVHGFMLRSWPERCECGFLGMAIQYISRARGLLKASFRPVTAPAARIALAPMPTAHSLDLAGKADPPPELTASDIDALPKVAARADAGTESPPAARGPTMDFSHVRVGAIPPSERPSPVDYRAIIEAAIAVL